MTSSRRDAVMVFAASVLVLLPGAFWGLPSGKAVAGALVILQGGVPYRDFWTMYAPGQFYAVALLYFVFGSELLVQAVAAAAAVAGAATAFFLLSLRLGAARSRGLVLTAAVVLMFWTTAPELTDYPLALPLLLIALGRIVEYYGEGGIVPLYRAGLWLGIASWFKHDVAAYVGIGAAASLCASWLLTPSHQRGGWIRPARAVTALALAAVAAAAPVAAWTAWTAGREAWNALFVFPATVFSDIRSNEFPPVVPDLPALAARLADIHNVRRALRASEEISTWIILYFPVITFWAALAVLAAARRRLDPGRLASLTLFVACMPFFWAAAHVQQNTHPYTLAVLGAAAGVIVWSAIGVEAARRLRVPVVAASIIYEAGLVTAAATSAAAACYEWDGSRVLALPGFRGVRVPARVYETLTPIGSFIRAHTAPGEPIYTGLARHDVIVINNSLLYAIAGRPPCCGFTELHPGIADRAAVQETIVQRLEQAKVRAVVLWQFGWPETEMERRKRLTVQAVPDAGSELLDRYLARNFQIVATHGEYRVLWRTSAGPVDSGGGVD